MDLLQVSGISKTIQGNPVVRGISMVQPAFRNMGIAGETGSGKSTLLKMIAGLVQPDEGSIVFEQKRVQGPDEQLIPGHPGIAYLSQYYELRNHYRMEELLSYASELPDAEAAELYRLCRIDHLLKRKTDQLSGGEKQRIALARLLVTAPRLLILDEPFSNLDLIHKNILKNILRDAKERFGLSLLLASHDPADLLPWADELLVLRNGQIVQQGAPQEVYDRPVDEYVAGLLGRYNLISAPLAQVLAEAHELPAGNTPLLIRPEHFRIGAAGPHTLDGTVRTVVFRGSYRDVEVLVGEQAVWVSTMERHLDRGDTVHVSLDVPGSVEKNI